MPSLYCTRAFMQWYTREPAPQHRARPTGTRRPCPLCCPGCHAPMFTRRVSGQVLCTPPCQSPQISAPPPTRRKSKLSGQWRTSSLNQELRIKGEAPSHLIKQPNHSREHGTPLTSTHALSTHSPAPQKSWACFRGHLVGTPALSKAAWTPQLSRVTSPSNLIMTPCDDSHGRGTLAI